MRFHRSISRSCVALAALTLGASVSVDADAAQTLRNKRIYFGDVHWHSCLSQDATSTPTSQYWSMLYDYGLDFSMETEHVEAADAGVIECDDYLPMIHATNGSVMPHSGNNIANAMKAAANEWNGRELASLHHGLIKFVTFPGYEWSPDARCWASTSTDPYPNDLNSDDTTPGHVSYFFSDTTGWSFGKDVWGPGPGPSSICVAASALGITYYEGSKDYLDELLGQLIHQRDDPDRSYDLLIQSRTTTGSTPTTRATNPSSTPTVTARPTRARAATFTTATPRGLVRRPSSFTPRKNGPILRPHAKTSPSTIRAPWANRPRVAWTKLYRATTPCCRSRSRTSMTKSGTAGVFRYRAITITSTFRS